MINAFRVKSTWWHSRSVVVLLGISIALSMITGALAGVAPSWPILVIVAVLALLACVLAPQIAVLILLALQSIAFYRTDDIDPLKIVYFVFHLGLVAGWLVYIAQKRGGLARIWTSVRHARSALPLALFMSDLVLTVLWLLGNADYLRWVRVFSQFTGYGMLFIIASSVQNHRDLRRMTFALWGISTITGLVGSFADQGLPIAVATNGQTNVILVVLLGLSLFSITDSLGLRAILLGSVVVVAARWLLLSLFSSEQSGLSLVIAAFAALVVWVSMSALVKVRDYRRLIGLFVIAGGVFGVGLVALFALQGSGLEFVAMVHRGTAFNPFDLSSVLSLPTMYLRIQEVLVTPTYLARSPFVGLGLTFEIPMGVLTDYYGRPVSYFGGFMHNGYLSMLLRLGILGLAIFCWFLASLFRDGWRLARMSSHGSKEESLEMVLGLTLCAFVASMVVFSVAASRFDDRGATTYLGILSGLTVWALRFRLNGSVEQGDRWAS